MDSGCASLSKAQKGVVMSVMKHEERSAWPLDVLWSEDRVDRMFRDMFRNFFTGEGLVDRFLEARPGLMRVEEYVEDDTCVIRAELPGIDPDRDVEVTVAEGVLHLRAEREERKEEARPTGYRSEFHYGRLERSIRLPEGATEADVKASYKDGILEVRVPAPKPVQPSKAKIPVEHK
jgi:HSP20 family protein